jgi:hypothetical protein
MMTGACAGADADMLYVWCERTGERDEYSKY